MGRLSWSGSGVAIRAIRSGSDWFFLPQCPVCRLRHACLPAANLSFFPLRSGWFLLSRLDHRRPNRADGFWFAGLRPGWPWYARLFQANWFFLFLSGERSSESFRGLPPGAACCARLFDPSLVFLSLGSKCSRHSHLLYREHGGTRFLFASLSVHSGCGRRF